MRYFSLLAFMTGTMLAQSSVSLSWTASTTPNSTVSVYRASSSCSATFVKIASGVSAAGPFIATNLINGGTYAFYIIGNAPGLIDSPPSNCLLMVITPPPPGQVAAPTGLTGTIIPQ